METLEILAAFALSFSFMLLLWSLEGLLLRPRKTRQKRRLKLLAGTGKNGLPHGGRFARDRAESPALAAAAEQLNQNIRSDGNDGGNE